MTTTTQGAPTSTPTAGGTQANSQPGTTDGTQSPQTTAQAAPAATNQPDKPAADANVNLTPEQKAAKEAADKAAADKTKVGAPEKYEAFKLPDGVKLDDAVMGEFGAVAKKLNLNQDSAQELVNIGVKLSQRFETQLAEAHQKQRSDWEAASKADKEFGGDKLAENLGTARKARDAFVTPEFNKFLDETGLGNHPEMIRAFFRIGKAISEDRPPPGTRGTDVSASAPLEERAAAKFYKQSA